jgi:hypothetical protein
MMYDREKSDPCAYRKPHSAMFADEISCFC